jgi:hypothetical protein
VIYLLSVTITDIVNWSTIASNIVTALGVIGAFVAFYAIVKNRLTKKNFTLKATLLRISINDETSDEFSLEIDLQNFTDKEFFITGISFSFDNKKYVLQHLENMAHGRIVTEVETKNVPISAHEALTLYGHLNVPTKTPIPKKCTVVLDTTERKLIYKIPLLVSAHLK